MNQSSYTVLELNRTETLHGNPALLHVRAQAENSACAQLPSVQTNAGTIVGVLAGFQKSDAPLVEFPENISGEPVPARSTIALDDSQIGCEVALSFERGDLARPIIFGCLRKSAGNEKGKPVVVERDGEKLVLSAKQEIVLRCGEASITLTRAGKILICGAYILSRSSGVSRIKGGSVQIN